MYRLLSNRAGVNAANYVELFTSQIGCCDAVSLPVCQYDITIPTANTVNNIVFVDPDTGLNKTVSFSSVGAADTIAAVNEAIQAEGYRDDSAKPYAITSRVSGSNTIYSITGEVTVISMTHNTSTVVNATKKCIKEGMCTWIALAGSGAGLLSVRNTVQNMTDIVYGSTTTASLKAAIESALTAGSSATSWRSVTVTDDTANSKYKITIVGGAGLNLAIDGTSFDRSDCIESYRS